MNTTENFPKAVCYADFGAIGDGIANDFESLMRAHEYANEKGLPVVAESDKTYRITTTEKDGAARQIVIKTPTDWKEATIIIDDTEMAHAEGKNRDYNSPVFKVMSYYDELEIPQEQIEKLPKIKIGTTKIDLGLGYPAMILIYNEDNRHYIRFGSCANSGNPQHELVVLDKDGNVDPTTPLMYDYDKITKIVAIRIDLPEMEIKNATFVSRASQIDTVKILPDGTRKNMNRAYFLRNIVVSRSNTTVRNLKHRITGEISVEEQAKGVYGPAYRGFFNATRANCVTIEDCIVCARRNYAPGTYGFSANESNNVLLKNCNQSNFYKRDADGNLTKVLSTEVHPLTKRPEYWGLGGSGFCKNMVYDGCEITRYDAHQGLCNGKILNCHISMINLIGTGDVLIENCLIELSGSCIVNLRRDYGSTWRGKVVIKDCKVLPNEEVTKTTAINVFNYCYTNHYFGYQCYFPSVVIDNLELLNTHLLPINMFRTVKPAIEHESPATEYNIHLPTLSDGSENLNPTIPPESFEVINNKKGHPYVIADVPFFANTKLVGIERIESTEIPTKDRKS